MSKRQVDICFAPDERLWRSISKQMVDVGGKVKGNRLRLQISVARSSKGRQSMDAAIHPTAPPEFNGIAELTVQAARDVSTDKINAICVDEPTADYEEHALIALVTTSLPGDVSQVDIDKARAMLANKMIVARKPTK